MRWSGDDDSYNFNGAERDLLLKLNSESKTYISCGNGYRYMVRECLDHAVYLEGYPGNNTILHLMILNEDIQDEGPERNLCYIKKVFNMCVEAGADILAHNDYGQNVIDLLKLQKVKDIWQRYGIYDEFKAFVSQQFELKKPIQLPPRRSYPIVPETGQWLELPVATSAVYYPPRDGDEIEYINRLTPQGYAQNVRDHDGSVLPGR